MFGARVLMKPGALIAKPLRRRQPAPQLENTSGRESSRRRDSARGSDLHPPEVSQVTPPVDTEGVVVPALLVERVKVVDAVVTPADEPVVGDHGSGDAREKDTVCAEVVSKGSGGLVQEPRVPKASISHNHGASWLGGGTTVETEGMWEG